MYSKYMVHFTVQTSLNLNQTFRIHSLRSGARFSKIGELNLESGPEFAKFMKKPDQTGLWHRYVGRTERVSGGGRRLSRSGRDRGDSKLMK
jgi:hypothetical protein